MAKKSISLARPLVFLLAVKGNGSRVKGYVSRIPYPVSRNGSILIISLWSLCLLSTFAVYLGYGVRQKLTLVNRLEERDKLRLIAEAGIKKAIVELKKENDSDTFREMAIGDGVTAILLTDEESKININKVALAVLERLFKIALGFDETEAQELAATIVDWRDSDSELSLPLGSAEDPYYRNLSEPYEAKDAEFEVLRELLLVKGMDENIFKKIKDYVTIYGNGKVNINTASGMVLLALGLSQDLIDKILSFRAGEDAISGTPDDNVFDAPANIVPRLSQVYSLSASELAQLSTIVDQNLVTNSSNFMLKATSRLINKKNTSDTLCIANRSGKILFWQES